MPSHRHPTPPHPEPELDSLDLEQGRVWGLCAYCGRACRPTTTCCKECARVLRALSQSIVRRLRIQGKI